MIRIYDGFLKGPTPLTLTILWTLARTMAMVAMVRKPRLLIVEHQRPYYFYFAKRELPAVADPIVGNN
jgi:hypothetical protein